MKLPEKLKIKKTDSPEIKELKQTVNALLDFHYQFHNALNINQMGGGGGC